MISKSDRHKMIEVTCQGCGIKFLAREERTKRGQGRFHSLECFNKSQREEGEKTRGKEFAFKYWNKTARRYDVHWRDNNGVVRGSTYAKWLWESLNGNIPDEYVAVWKDGNSKNIDINNLELQLFGDVVREKVAPHLVGIKRSDESRAKMSVSGHKKKLSKEHKRKLGEAIRGEKNRFWIDGRSYIEYPPEFNYLLKKRVRRRDKYLCRACNKRVVGKHGHIHHIDGNKQNSNVNNLILLCDGCHKIVHMKSKTSNLIIKLLQASLVTTI